MKNIPPFGQAECKRLILFGYSCLFCACGNVNTLLALELFIEDGVCGGHVCIYPQDTHAADKSAEDAPADKAELKAEKTPFVALHHCFASVKALAPAELGVVAFYEICN